MSSYFIEIRPTVRRSGPPLLVPLSDSHKYRGFRSVFAYDEATTESIREMRGTSHLRGCEVYADTLFVDFDNHDGEDLIGYLLDQGIGFEKWHSGNRSIHLHIPMVPVFGEWVPRSCKKWMQSRTKHADLSFLHPAGQYRLPGTYHYKNPGKCKILLEARPGKLLEIERVDRKPSMFGPVTLDEGSIENFFFFLTGKASEGSRRPYIWKLCVLGLEAGMGPEEVLAHVEWWNSRFCEPPHPQDILELQLEQALIYTRRKSAG